MCVAESIRNSQSRKRIVVRRAIALLCLLLFCSGSHHATGARDVTIGRRAASRAGVVWRDAKDEATPAFDPLLPALVFDDVWRTIQERYYDPALRGVDWTGLRNAGS